MIITIDGPTASGKSTMGRMLADYFHFIYLNSGALYRALAYLLMTKEGYSLAQLENPKIEDIKKYFVPERLSYSYDSQGEKVFFDHEDIWPHLKTSTMDKAASVLSMHPMVRTALLQFQRSFANNHDVVVDGRDCGSIVFPQAQVKFFLQASLDTRAHRWQLVQQERGASFNVPQATATIAERDARDTQRVIAPLIVPEGAVLVDNSGMNIEQTFEVMKAEVEKNLHKKIRAKE